MEKVWDLHPFFAFRVSIIQDPFIAGQVAEVSAAIKDVSPHLLEDATVSILKQEVSPLVTPSVVFGLRKNMISISPDKM